ncbi:putative disease resistance protein RGA3 [Platanthera zijinensis]|uniref:Disease resistance protein RGA3 n=1 Tax=Platanthera zijinensis TaxID=2320716 RepID=A0AAP0B5W8_9ASPA
MGVERNPNLVEIGRQIVKKCGGVPLAAKALGSLLRFKKTESDWMAIKDSELWKLSGDDNYEILPALKLSYDHLSSCLKQCFTYCSIFPKDYEIDVTMLVRLWDAEGFLKPSDGQMDMQQIGQQYVDELLYMHKALHVISSNVTLVRALHLKSCPLRSLPDSFKKLKHLRYLDLSSTDLDSFPPCISTLQNLKTLNLSQTNIKSIPDSIGNLCNLSTLDLGYCSHRSSLPESICALSNLHTLTLKYCRDYFFHKLPQNICNVNRLVHLDIHGTQLTCLPRRLGKLSQLRTLPIFICGEEEGCSLAELGSLKLEGELQIKALQRVTSSCWGCGTLPVLLFLTPGLPT